MPSRARDFLWSVAASVVAMIAYDVYRRHRTRASVSVIQGGATRSAE